VRNERRSEAVGGWVQRLVLLLLFVVSAFPIKAEVKHDKTVQTCRKNGNDCFDDI
jgi:hypothetical protein